MGLEKTEIEIRDLQQEIHSLENYIHAKLCELDKKGVLFRNIDIIDNANNWNEKQLRFNTEIFSERSTSGKIRLT